MLRAYANELPVDGIINARDTHSSQRCCRAVTLALTSRYIILPLICGTSREKRHRSFVHLHFMNNICWKNQFSKMESTACGHKSLYMHGFVATVGVI